MPFNAQHMLSVNNIRVLTLSKCKASNHSTLATLLQAERLPMLVFKRSYTLSVTTQLRFDALE